MVHSNVYQELISLAYDKILTSQCRQCAECKFKSENRCQGCWDCLNHIHFSSDSKYDGRSDYECPNIVNYYVYNYLNVYASEIFHLLDAIDSGNYSNFSSYNILSLGCGPCPDLVAFDSYNEKTSPKRNISYVGVDINPYWKVYQDKVKELLINSFNVQFENRDAVAITELLRQNENINIIIVHNLISFLYAHDRSKIESLFNCLQDFIKNKTSFLLIINDVNSCYCGRDDIEKFCKQLNSIREELVIKKYCFGENLYVSDAIQHKNSNLVFGSNNGTINNKIIQYVIGI